jgi:hypothetical protein
VRWFQLKQQVFGGLGYGGGSAFRFGGDITSGHAAVGPGELLAAIFRGLLSRPDGV